ncbi:uncharacterized protein LOC108743229 [Agrilus planipennis]|uniref:Uncharacterized protein LOC108743229 n=1 Tax=Agrilus planipennis TaxID=224129 RepID=A0A7F5RCV5_AGRPL|nr:uncharacterized protein LOC108743229 [Agrilus planipennis]
MKTYNLIILISSILSLGLPQITSLRLVTYISDNGLHGTIHFEKLPEGVKLITNLNVTLEYPSQIWSWALTEFPTDYSQLENRCDFTKIGNEILNFDDIYGYLLVPENGTSEFVTKDLDIRGPKGLFGKSILLKNLETRRKVCGSIIFEDKTVEKAAVAKFNSPLAGNVYFKWFSTKDNHSDMLITSDLYHVAKTDKLKSIDHTEHSWKIYVTEILDHKHDRSDINCNILQLVFDPEDKGDGHAIGDIDKRVGKVKISTDPNKNRYKMFFRDEELILLPNDLTGPHRRLYLVIFENKHPDSFLACANIRYEHPINAKVIIQSGGIKGEINLSQNTKFEPTMLDFNLTTARGDVETKLVYSSSVAGYKIHELPMQPPKTVAQIENACLTTKFVYNPLNVDVNFIPPNGYGTQNQYPIGDLSGKLLGRNNASGLLPGSQELKGQYWDTFLPLQGQHSIIHRSLVIYKNTYYTSSDIQAEPWICGSIALYEQNMKYQKQIFTAEVTFRYPIVGRILFRQPRDEPWTDTTVMVEYLIHADGSSFNNSADHRWAIHENPHGKDFYNWSGRCLSAGAIYNPYKVDFDNKTSPEKTCNLDSINRCRLGDLSTRLGTVAIAGRLIESDKVSRKVFTDPLLPLTGLYGILGKSFVIYDDFGPKARGERLACSIIGGVYRRKAVAKDWFPNGEPSSVQGKLEFYQQTEFEITNVEVDIEGLEDTSGYHVHITPVEENLEFPCEATTLYGHWNPLNVDPTSSPRTYQGTPDQYEMGDLSGKFGTLDNYTKYTQSYNDTMLPLFGPRSIIGRSIVIHKKGDNRRWACSTIERGYSPSEAREIRAIASFHHPDGYAYGYFKMKQLIYNDGSKSDTVIEIKLRHPGVNDRNITRDHNWAIFVNPVGVDAAVKTQATRCVAGGYVWNPFYTQLADPLNEELYRQECGPKNPLRCYVGDLSARLGTIDIGLNRVVLVDSNFPLEGDVTAIGRSIVIMSPNKNHLKYACANIEPDYDIIKYANIEKPPRFVLAQFIENIRAVMGIPEWMLNVDSRKTKYLHHDACVQLLLHFKGPIANKLEQDFNRLITIGRLEAPSLYIPGYINTKRKSKLSYKQCGRRDPNEPVKSRYYENSNSSRPTLKLCTLAYLFLIFIYNFVP